MFNRSAVFLSKPLDKNLSMRRIPFMVSGAEQLKDWMERRGIKKQSDAAEMLGLDIPFMSMLLNGKRTPGLTNAVRIEQITGIPVEAWLLSKVNETTSDDSSDTRKPQLHKA